VHVRCTSAGEGLYGLEINKFLDPKMASNVVVVVVVLVVIRFSIFNSLRLCRFSTDRNETFYNY